MIETDQVDTRTHGLQYFNCLTTLTHVQCHYKYVSLQL